MSVTEQRTELSSVYAGKEPIGRCLEVRWRRKWGRTQFGDKGNDSEDIDEVQGQEGERGIGSLRIAQLSEPPASSCHCPHQNGGPDPAGLLIISQIPNPHKLSIQSSVEMPLFSSPNLLPPSCTHRHTTHTHTEFLSVHRKSESCVAYYLV